LLGRKSDNREYMKQEVADHYAKSAK